MTIQTIPDAPGSTGASAAAWAAASWPRRVAALALVVLIVGVGGGVGFWLGARQATTPADRSPEVGFGRDMMQHHAQAVDMAMLLRDRSDDPELRQLALDILLTQQAQIGQIQGWLAVWGQPVASTEPAMTWMGRPTTGPLPGMAGPADLNHLRDLRGREAEGLFLRLMIPHHRAGVAMARAVLERTQRPEVRALAHAIVAGQTSEIALMQELLRRKGFPSVPDTAPMRHG